MKKFLPMFRLLGLGEQEAHTYLSLLEYGTLGITELGEKTSLHRTQLYRVLPFLIELGLVVQTQTRKKKLYAPASPQVLQAAFDTIATQNSQNIAYLDKLYQNIDSKPTVIYEKWAKWVKHVFEDIVNSTQKMRCLLSYYFRNWYWFYQWKLSSKRLQRKKRQKGFGKICHHVE